MVQKKQREGVGKFGKNKRQYKGSKKEYFQKNANWWPCFISFFDLFSCGLLKIRAVREK